MGQGQPSHKGQTERAGTRRPVMRHVIIGASVAGITAAARIKELSPEQEVIVLSGEGVRPYGKMSLPYVLSGRTGFENCMLPLIEGVEILLNKYVDKVDTVSKTVHMTVSYTHLRA